MPLIQEKIPIKEIREEIIILDNGSLQAILKCSSLNFFLRSTEEQNALTLKYQEFLNSLDFPIQILILSRRLNLDNYLQKLEERKKNQENELLRIQTSQYIEYIQKLTEITNLVGKEFYLIIPYQPIIINRQGILSKFKNLFGINNSPNSNQLSETFEKNFSNWRYQLQERVEYIAGGLSSLGIQANLIERPDIVNLFYHLYNLDKRGEIIKNIEANPQ